MVCFEDKWQCCCNVVGTGHWSCGLRKYLEVSGLLLCLPDLATVTDLLVMLAEYLYHISS